MVDGGQRILTDLVSRIYPSDDSIVRPPGDQVSCAIDPVVWAETIVGGGVSKHIKRHVFIYQISCAHARLLITLCERNLLQGGGLNT